MDNVERSRRRRAAWRRTHCYACGGEHERTCIECGAEIACCSVVEVQVDCGLLGLVAVGAPVLRYERPAATDARRKRP